MLSGFWSAPGSPGVGDVALLGRVGDQEEDESADDQQDQQRCDDIAHTQVATPGRERRETARAVGRAVTMAD